MILTSFFIGRISSKPIFSLLNFLTGVLKASGPYLLQHHANISDAVVVQPVAAQTVHRNCLQEFGVPGSMPQKSALMTEANQKFRMRNNPATFAPLSSHPN
jgi:hypothetical protein